MFFSIFFLNKRASGQMRAFACVRAPQILPQLPGGWYILLALPRIVSPKASINFPRSPGTPGLCEPGAGQSGRISLCPAPSKRALCAPCPRPLARRFCPCGRNAAGASGRFFLEFTPLYGGCSAKSNTPFTFDIQMYIKVSVNCRVPRSSCLRSSSLCSGANPHTSQ